MVHVILTDQCSKANAIKPIKRRAITPRDRQQCGASKLCIVVSTTLYMLRSPNPNNIKIDQIWSTERKIRPNSKQ